MKTEKQTVVMPPISPENKDNYMTDHVAGGDIKEYVGSKMVYLPAGVDSTRFREITPKEHEAYEELKKIAMDAYMEANKPK